MSIVINQQIPAIAVQGVAADVVLQPGNVVNARVLQVLGNDQVRIAIGAQSLDVLSQVPLQAGQTLQLAVSQTADGVRLAVINPQGGAAASPSAGELASSAASPDTVTLASAATFFTAAQTLPAAIAMNNQLTPQEALAVSSAAQVAATQQTGLAPLFANLGVAAGMNDLPVPVQLAVTQLLAQRTSLDENLSGSDVQQAFQSSGLFLESSLASGSVPSADAPDLKAALIVLRQVLANALIPSINDATAAQSATAAPTTTVAPSTTVVQGAAVAQEATIVQGAAVVQGATVAQSTIVQAVVVPQDTASQPGAAAQSTGPAPVPTSLALEQGAQLVIGLPQPVIIITDASVAPGTVSPVLTPSPAAETGLAGAAAPLVPDQAVTGFSATAPVVATASTAADAAARAAANTAVLSLLQEEPLQLNPQLALNPGLAFDDSLTLSLLPAIAGAQLQHVDDDADIARSNMPPPPIGGTLPAAQAVVAATLVSNSPAETAMHHLIADAEGALARQTLLQVASLPDRGDSAGVRQEPGAARWNFEIPFVTPRGTAMAQFEISHDGGSNGVEAAKRVWRARFSLDVEPAGPVHALISLSGDKTSVRMWAERPATAAQLRAGAPQLSQALVSAELNPGDIVIGDGAPPQAAPVPAGHFLDRAL
jgi:hypothetical protein